MPSGPAAEFGESSLIASIIIESERVISDRNVKGKMLQTSV